MKQLERIINYNYSISKSGFMLFFSISFEMGHVRHALRSQQSDGLWMVLWTTGRGAERRPGETDTTDCYSPRRNTPERGRFRFVSNVCFC